MANFNLDNQSPDRITAVVSPRSIGNLSLFLANQDEIENEPGNFISDKQDIRSAKRELTKLGFTIESESEATISISGDKSLFESLSSKKLRKQKSTFSPDIESEFYDSAEKDNLIAIPDSLSGLIEGIAITQPPEYFASPSPLPPLAPIDNNAYRYLHVPDEIALVLRATRTHRTGAPGKSIKVAMPDTGFYRHPFYNHHGYRTQKALLAAGAVNAASNNVGHGTGEAANIFAVAPDITLIPIKMGDPVDSIKKARTSGAKVISNSWGYDIDKGTATWSGLHPYLKALALEILLVVNAGIVVCFSAGNGHYAFPASMPAVIAVGGVHVNYPDLIFEASSYASSFVSKIFPARKVPDVCGLTGKRVNINGGKAPSIMLSVQPGCSLDSIDPSTGSANDGWGIFSGTSAACSQIAGICALMLEKDPSLTPAQIKVNLIKSARDVKAGQSAMGDSAMVGHDSATGAGLADAKWAYLISMGGVAAKFFSATGEEKIQMLTSNEAPKLEPEFVEDLIETLRSV
ncbi:S8 family serine peptidase [Aliikangiella maris]|uniref:S8 family serine peptidase n=2 Tax=Aliikangiella maris TaxID=3162458 RepID=A0ABV2BUV0_9GAMM